MKRRNLMIAAGVSMMAGIDGVLQTVEAAVKTPGSSGNKNKMPVVFVGHGSPINVMMENRFTQSLGNWGRQLEQKGPKAIVVISAHWLTNGKTLVDASEQPKMIYDFYGFPDPMYKMQYPSKGAPQLAKSISEKIMPQGSVITSTDWGLDHGSWTILKHMFPKANIPVFELSIDYSKGARFHYELGQKLAYLREQGVLIIGSGNIVHNLGKIDRGAPEDVATREWAKKLDDQVKSALIQSDVKTLIAYEKLQGAREGIETAEHYFPLLYTLGAADKSSQVSQMYEGFSAGTISMRAVQWD